MTVATKGLFTALMTDASDSTLLHFDGKLANFQAKKKHRFRAYLAVKQGFRCYYCKCTMTLERPKNDRQQPNYTTFEHLYDVFAGGGRKNDDAKVIAVACYKCNAARGSEQNSRAFKYYGQFFFKKHTLRKFVDHPKVGWAGIIREFGPIPADFN
jgi:hypothetical protein